MRPTYTPIMINATALEVAGMMEAESSAHGSPRVSFGDLAIDSGGNAFTVDRTATVYVVSDRPLPASLLLAHDPEGWACNQGWTVTSEDEIIYRGPEWRARMIAAKTVSYGVTVPAYNAWHACEVAGLAARDYGQTWRIYASRAEYLESLD